MPMTRHQIDKLLAEPNVAVVAVTAPDGSPHAVPTWYEYRAGAVTFHSDSTAFKYKCLRLDPRVTMCVDTKDAPYKAAILKGHVTMVEKVDDARLERMAIHYLGRKEGSRYAKSLKGSRVVVVTLKPSRIISWDYSRESP